MVTHSTLGETFRGICQKLGAPPGDSMYRTKGNGLGDPHVEIIGNQYDYVVTERGSEMERRSTEDADELMYWLVSDLIFRLASVYELQNRITGQDNRRILFQKEVELFSVVNPDWTTKRKLEINETLRTHPFKDSRA